MSGLLHSERVVVWAPNGRDAVLAHGILRRRGIVATIAADVEALCLEIDGGAGCAIVTEVALAPAACARIQAQLKRQPPWSDFPFIVFAPTGYGHVNQTVDAAAPLGNVTMLERPVQVRTLLSAVASALRARRRQYEAAHAIQRRDEFLAMLGHELRNPLGAILLAADLMSKVGADGPGSKQRTIIERQARHLSRLVDDLLDVSRVTSGKVVLERGTVDIGELVQRCVQSMEMSARTKSIQLGFTDGGQTLAVDGDAVRLEEVFNNLLHNAIKYSPSGSRIDVTARIENGVGVVEVADTGIGISVEMLSRVFELFAQADATLDRSQGGLGIGLTLVKSLVELHGGVVDAHSEGVGQGSRFVVRLPLAASSAQAEAARPRLTSVAMTQTLRVVVVEDNNDIREITKDVLETLGCDVHTAGDGAAGLAHILSAKPDVAVVDIGLPGMDGFELARQVRAAGLASVRLVAMTGYGQPEDRRRALDAGFDEHLTKPVNVERLQSALAPANGGVVLHRVERNHQK